jgi:hypothetical protein
MNDRKPNSPSIDYMKGVRDFLSLDISDERLEQVLSWGLGEYWEFSRSMESISLKKEDDPAKFLATMASLSEKIE